MVMNIWASGEEGGVRSGGIWSSVPLKLSPAGTRASTFSTAAHLLSLFHPQDIKKCALSLLSGSIGDPECRPQDLRGNNNLGYWFYKS